MKQHPYFISLKEVIDDYTPESLSQLDEEGRDTLFRKFWVNYMERMAKENRHEDNNNNL